MKLSWVRTRTGLLVLLLCTGCATAYRENVSEEQPVEVVLSDEELDEQFTSDQLSQARLSAMEAGAKQKLQDLVDYLNIIGNTTLDSAFRQEAARQAERLFVDSQVALRLSSGDQEERTVRQSLAALLRSQTQKSFAIDDLAIRQSLTADTDLQYQGTLSFVLSSNSVGVKQQADFLVKKVYKEFGREKEWVWELFLGDIR